MLREVQDESSVEVDKTDEGLDLLFVGRGRPFRYTSYLHWVHFDLVVQDDNAKVFDAGFFELTLLVSEVQLVFAQPFHDHATDRVCHGYTHGCLRVNPYPYPPIYPTRHSGYGFWRVWVWVMAGI
jgi:hypothetical protein